MEPSADAGSAAPLRVPMDRLLTAVWWFAGLAVVVSVARHALEALGSASAGSWSQQFAAVAPSAWIWAALHLACAAVSLGLGYLVLSWAYPLRHLTRTAATNPAATVQAGAHLMGATIIACASWGGDDAASLAVSAVFCLLGWLSLAGILALHRLVTTFRDHEEIADGNVAAALASAGLHLAVALVVGHAIEGQFDGWRTSLLGFVTALVWVLLLYPLRQIVLARLILRLKPRDLDAAIASQHDLGLGAAEALCYVVAALCLSAGW